METSIARNNIAQYKHIASQIEKNKWGYKNVWGFFLGVLQGPSLLPTACLCLLIQLSIFQAISSLFFFRILFSP